MDKKGKKIASSKARLMALIFDISIGYIVINTIQNIPYYKQFNDQLISIISQVTLFIDNKYLYDLVSFIIILYIFTWITRLWSTLILSISIGQVLMGIRTSGSFTDKRLGGVSRVFIEFFTTPFILFELPCLFNRQTAKEIISGHRLEQKISIGFFSKIFISLTPIITIFIVILSSFSSLIFTKTIPIKNNIIIDKIGIKKSSIKPNNNIYSETFQFKTKLSLYNNRYFLLPSFYKVKNKKDLLLKNQLLVIDTSKKQIIKLTRPKDISFKTILKKIIPKNPLLIKRYPELVRAIKSKNYKKLSKKDKFLYQLEDFIRESLLLNIKNIIYHIKDNGPFIKSHLLFKNEILNFFNDLPPADIASITKIGNDLFLRLNWNKLGYSGFVGLSGELTPVLKWSWKDKESFEQFIDYFFKTSTWLYSLNTNIKDNYSNKDNSLYILDNMFFSNSNVEQQDLNHMLEQKYKKATDYFITINDDKFKEEYKSYLISLYMLAKENNQLLLAGKMSEFIYRIEGSESHK